MASKTRRTSSWTFVCYPESLPPDYEKRFEKLHVPLAYIMHSMDRAADGSHVKDHIHVLVKYDSVKAHDQVASDFEWTGIAYFEPVRSFHAMTRYLIHKDNPEKYQYKEESVKTCSGLSLDFSKHYTPDEQIQMVIEMTMFCEDNDIRDFSVLWNHCAQHNKAWLQVLVTKASYAVNQYIRNRNYRICQDG